MKGLWGGLSRFAIVIALMSAVTVAAAPSASALNSNDSITLSGPSTQAEVGQTWSLTGGGTDDGTDISQPLILQTPASAGILTPSCPTSYAAAQSAIEAKYGEETAELDEIEGAPGPFPDEPGPYTFTATVNGGLAPSVTEAGSYVACAYLVTQMDADPDAPPPGETDAVSSPLTYSVTAPAGSGTPAPSPGEKLTVAPTRLPVRPKGLNLIKVSGIIDGGEGRASLSVTLKNTRTYNGCASTAEQDEQLTRASGGRTLALLESVTASNGAGRFSAPVEMNFTKHPPRAGTYELCAYLEAGFSNIASGSYRFKIK
jgi:hypothetical protein